MQIPALGVGCLELLNDSGRRDRKMITRQSFLDALIAAISWIAGVWLVHILLKGLDATEAYAVIVGWWLTAYISSKLVLHISLVIPLFFMFLSLFIIAAACGQSWFYREISSLSLVDLFEIGLAQSLFVCSPIIFDYLFCKIINIFSK